MLRGILSFLLGAVLWALPAQAHEFWIDPIAFAVEAKAPLQADIRIGENFSGSASTYVPINFKRFEIWTDGTATAVEGRLGDKPALNMPVGTEGLATVVYQTRAYTLTYVSMEKFAKFAKHKDFEWAVAAHQERGLSKDRFKERYIRFGKSLMASGTVAGADVNVGLEAEIIALANPFTHDPAQPFPVKVLYQGAPRPQAQVELFEKAPDGAVTVHLFTTDAQGVAQLTVQRGHRYLADHVVLRPIEPEAADGPVWESLWASLTFELPQ